MKPHLHARNSVKKYGGEWEDYIEIHDFLDSTKSHFPDMRHRAILHNSFGCFLAEKLFGHLITNSEGKEISVRDIAEDHKRDFHHISSDREFELDTIYPLF
jgi:hypothetical protein